MKLSEFVFLEYLQQTSLFSVLLDLWVSLTHIWLNLASCFLPVDNSLTLRWTFTHLHNLWLYTVQQLLIFPPVCVFNLEGHGTITYPERLYFIMSTVGSSDYQMCQTSVQ